METASEVVKSPKKQLWYRRNKIVQVVHRCAVNLGKDPLTYESEFKTAMQAQLNISKRLSAIMNNTFPPSIEELVAMAGWLEKPVDDLIVTSDED